MRIRPVGFRPPLRATLHRRVRRLSHMRFVPRPGQFLSHEPPPSAPLKREPHIPAALETGHPLRQHLPRGRLDPSPAHLPRLLIQTLERDLTTMHIHPTYDSHETSSRAPPTQGTNTSIVIEPLGGLTHPIYPTTWGPLPPLRGGQTRRSPLS